MGYEIDTNRAKFGDGINPWNDLEYWNPYGVINASVYRNGSQILTGVTGFNFTGSSVSGITGSNGFANITISGGTGPTGAGGTGANTFYGSQTISGPSGTLILGNYSSLGFTGDAPAEAAGIPVGGLYHDTNPGAAGTIRIRLT